MSYRMSQHDYVISATCMFDVSLLQCVIRLGVLDTHDTKQLRVVEVEWEYIFSLVRNDLNSFNRFGIEVLTF